MTIKKYNILESELSSKAYEAGNLYFCTDSANIYYDSTLEEKRIHINNSMIALETEADRENLLNPILYKIYFIKETNRSYIYIGAEWVRVGISSWNDLEDKPFDTIRTETVVLDEMTFYGGGSGIQISIEEEFENVEHTVIFDGVEYKCTPNITDGDSVLGDSGYWYCLTYDYPFGISYIHKQLYTSDGSTHTIKVVKNVSETVKQIEDKYISENIARIDDLMQSDYDQNDSSSLDHIKNRPFYKETREITWDGDTTSKTAVNLTENISYYKVADIPNDIKLSDIENSTTEFVANDGSSTVFTKDNASFNLYTNVYVACSSSGIFYSTDGKTWMPTTVSNSITRIVCINGILFAWLSRSANNGSGLWYSFNGIDWNKTSINSNSIADVKYDNGLYVAGIWNYGGLYYSTDGIEWTQSNITNTTIYSILYSNGLWIASSYYGGLYYSTDGMTWTQSNITSGIFFDIHYANGTWIVGNEDDNGLWYSTDGMTWTQSNITSGRYDSVIKYSNNLWVAGQRLQDSTSTGLWYSADGMTWTQSNITNTNISFINYFNEKNIWIAGSGNNSTGIYYSTDGMTWTQSNITTRIYQSITYADNKFVACTSGFYAGLYYSTDGMAWIKADTKNINVAAYFAKYANGIWICGSSNRDSTIYSEDGISWHQTNIANIAFTNMEYILTNDAYSNTYVIIVSKDNTTINGVLFEKSGIYFMHISVDGSSGYINSFKYEFVKNIDNNYIDDNVFVATYGLTTYDEIREAKDAGKVCVCNLNYSRYTVVATLVEYTASYMRFNYLNGSSQNVGVFIYSGTNKWTISTWNLEKVSNLVTTINSSSTDTTYPSSKAVYDYVNAAVSDVEIELSTTITSASTNDESPSSKAVYNYVNDVLTQLETMSY